jgi:hypothetical protein
MQRRGRLGGGRRLILAAVAVLAMPAGVLACACCTDEGQRLESTGPMQGHERAVWDEAAFAATVHFYASPGFPDSVEGVANPSTKPYRLRLRRNAGRLVFDIADPEGKGGQIALPAQTRFTRFEVDTRDERTKDRGQGPLLYKEWRLEGEARLSGVFAAGAKQAMAKLILHGSGNSCTDGSSFTHWSLVVRGRGVRFTLIGALRK